MAQVRITAEVAGLAKALKMLEGLGTRVPAALAAALYQEAEAVMARSKQEFVPVDTGTLRASGYVEPPALTDGGILVTLGYGGAAAAYALKQHEDLALHHPNGGQAKYLETPLNEAATGMADRVAAAAGRQLGW
jgi:hypothetical protein